uniref:Solute carrier family 22 member 2 n=1 Tax=Seriola lalandi dorsalis TaxID=1841481 RepID=A0A3B4WYL0_SERLL
PEIKQQKLCDNEQILLMNFWGVFLGCVKKGFGRKMSFLMSNLLNGIAGILVAVAPDYVSLLIFRTLYGFGVKGGWVAGYVLITEIVGVEYRRTVGVLYQMFFSVGILLLPLLAYFITDWRWLQVDRNTVLFLRRWKI